MDLSRPKWAARAPKSTDTPSKFWTIENKSSSDEADVYIYNEIGFWGVTADDFLKDISGISASTINLRVNSPGGDVFDGIAIMNTLRAHDARVVVHVDGLAASIASVIAMAGDEIVMGPNSQMMIHDASGCCFGNATDMADCAKLLDMISDNIASVYATKAGGESTDWRDTMKAETWYTAQAAVDAGLADRIADVKKKSAPDEDASDKMAARWVAQFFPERLPVNKVEEVPETEPVKVDLPTDLFSGVRDLFAAKPPVMDAKSAIDLFLNNAPEPDEIPKSEPRRPVEKLVPGVIEEAPDPNPPAPSVLDIKGAVRLFVDSMPEQEIQTPDDRNIPGRNQLASALNPAAIADAIRGRI